MLLRRVIVWLRRVQAPLGLLAVVGFTPAAPVEIVLQRGHDVEVGAVVYSPDGRIIASVGKGEAIRLWDCASGDLVRTLPGHTGRSFGLAFSPDGRWLASCGTEGFVKLWDYRAGRLAHLFTNHVGDWVRRVAFSPDSRWLVPASYDGKMSVWDVASGAVVRTLPTGRAVPDVAFTPDGRFIVTAWRKDDSHLIRFWDAVTGEPGLTFDHSNVVACLAVSRDGHRLAVGGDQGVVNLWELPSGRWLRRFVTPEQNYILSLGFNADGSRLAVAGSWVSTIWATEAGRWVGELRGHEDNTMSLSYSPDGREVITGSSDASVGLWNAADGSLRRMFARRPPNTPATSVAFSADGRFEALGTVDGRVRVWDARDGGFKFDLAGHEGAVQALAFSTNGAWLFSGSADRTKRVWDLKHGTVSAIHAASDQRDAMGAVAVGGREGLIATASGPQARAGLDHSIRLWESHDAWPRFVLTGHTASVCSLAFTAGSDLLASASLDGTVKLWNSRRGQCLRTVTNGVMTEVIAFLPGAHWLAAGLADGTVRVLDTNTLATARAWRAHQQPVQSLAISGDGRWLATASPDQTVAVWNWETGGELRRFTNVTSQFLPLAFHPRQPVLAFAQRDEMVVHANVETGEILFQRVLFPDGEWLAWNPAKAFYMASPRGDEHARVRFADQLVPVYPLELYRGELRRATNLLAALAGPAPLLVPKNFQLWWHRYPYKRGWFYGGLAVALVWVVYRLRRGWIAERRRHLQENVSRLLIVSQEAERKRIAAELHDSLGQNLLIIKNRLYLAQRETMGATPTAQLEEISRTVSQTIDEVREISHNLRPYQLDRLGLTKAVQAVVKKVADSGSLAIESHITGLDGLFSPEGEINFYRIVQESLSNILRHSDAATARLSIEQAEGKVRMSIADDGRGFDYRAMMSDAKQARGFGLTGLSERVRILGGRFECDSAPGQGTRLTFEIPVPTQHEKGNQNSDG